MQNRYLIKRPLAQGGMFTVYEGEAVHLSNAPVEVKETFFAEARLREQLQQEASVLAQLSHPALPKVSDHFVEGAGQFLVMESIPGQDLESILKHNRARGKSPFDWHQVMEWADQLLDALEYLHDRQPPVIHRNIKPRNLKLTPGGELFLIDFGLTEDATALAKPLRNAHAYTLGYAPPEQIKGIGTDARSDLYSLGATLHHLLTGEMPDNARVREQVIQYGAPDLLSSVHELNPQVPEPVAEVILRALALNPAERHQSADGMRGALLLAVDAAKQESADHDGQRAEQRKQMQQERRRQQDTRQRQLAEDHRSQTETIERERREEQERRRQEEEQRLKEERQRELAEHRKQAEEQRREQETEVRRREEQLAEQKQAEQQQAEQRRQQAETPVAEPATALLPESKLSQEKIEARKPRRLPVIGLAMGAAAVVLLLVYLAWPHRKAQIAAQRSEPTQLPAPQAQPSATPGIEAPEALQYWFELKDQTARVTTPQLTPDQKLRLHFKAPEDGYLYLLSLNEREKLIAFLPGAAIKAGSEIFFPPSREDWIQGQKDIRQIRITVLLAPNRIRDFDRLMQRVRRDAASQTEAIEMLKAQTNAISPIRTEDLSERGTPAIAVNATLADKPLIFDIILEYATK
ncbi:MAG: protein kinase [Acidobacteriota bacterium]